MRRTYTQEDTKTQFDAVEQADAALGVIEGGEPNTYRHNASTTTFCTDSNPNIIKDKAPLTRQELRIRSMLLAVRKWERWYRRSA